MSSNVIQSTTAQPKPQTVPSYEEKMSWSMRWFALIILSTGYIASIITGIIGFSITRDPHFLIFTSPTLFTPAIYYLVPMDSRHFELKKLKIQANTQLKTQRQQKKKWIP
jgi:hypothetical protein